MAKFLSLTISVLLFSGCSREANIAIPEALPKVPYQETPAGDDATSETEIPSVPGDTELPIPDPIPAPVDPVIPEMPETTRTALSEPHEVLGELTSFYNRETGLWPEGWKTSAYATMAIIDYMDRTKTLDFTWMLDTTYRKNMFSRDDFEENAAWGLAWLSAYDLTKELRYLEAAKTLHDQIINAAWDETCGGGLYGKLDKTSKTTAANLLFVRLSASLHKRLPEIEAYRENAMKVWTWFTASPLVDAEYRLKNAMASDSCTASSESTNTQSQGLILGALASLNEMSQDAMYLSLAKSYVKASFADLLDEKFILIEKNVSTCSPCANAESLYKGIYIQNLAILNGLTKDENIDRFLTLNSQSAWSGSRGSGGMVGYNWHSAFDQMDSSRQASAAFLFNSQILKPLERNYAFNGDTRTSANCTANEVASKAYDASASTKWCGAMVSGAINHLSVDLGAQRLVKSVRIMHAGTGGESRTLNTKDFELQISSNGSDFTDLATVRGNLSSMSFHQVNGTGRYLRLRFTTPGADGIGRIYEISAE